MKQMISNIKKFKILFYSLSILTIINFAVYPASYTKYTTKEKEFLKYSSNIVSLTKADEGSMTLKSSTKTEANLEFSLPKNNADIGPVDNDLYKLILPEGCSTQNKEITFGDTDNVTIELTCDVTNSNIIKEIDNKKYLSFSVEVNEIVNDEIPFRYKEYNYHEEYTPLNQEEEETKPNNRSTYDIDIKTAIINSIIIRDKYKNYTTEISSYINSADTTNNTLNLLGITVNYDEEHNQYNYQLDDNFIGYACTYYENMINQNEANTMIFSTTNRDEIELIFEYYLNEYYNFNNDQYYLILNYIKSKNGISSLIIDKENIEGISLLKENTITVDTNILDYASSLIESNTLNIYPTNNDNSRNIFLAVLSAAPEIPETIKEKISVREDIISYATKSYNPNDLLENNFLIEDESGYFLIEVLQNEKYNKITITQLIVSNEENNILNFTINYNNTNKPTIEHLNSIMYFIAQEFVGESVKDTLIQTEENENIIITFKVKKKETTPPTDQIENDPNIGNNDNLSNTDTDISQSTNLTSNNNPESNLE